MKKKTELGLKLEELRSLSLNGNFTMQKRLLETVARAWNVFAEKILEAIDAVNLLFEQIREAYYYPTSRRYRIVKVFSKCTGMDIRFCWKITWEIRRWIVRNRCKYLSGLL